MSNLILDRGAKRLSGRQALEWSPTGHDGTSREHVLRVPLQDVTPAIDPGVVGVREAADFSAREIYTAGKVHELEATLRFDAHAESLIQMAMDAARGSTLTFYPDVDNPGGNYDVEMVEPTGDQMARLSETRGIFREYDLTIRLRRPDGSPFGPEIFTGLLFSYRAGWDLSRATYSRASDATYTDIAGNRQTATDGEARDAHYVTDEDGNTVRAIKLEAARTNELHNATSPATQTRNLTAGDYVLWMEGTGSVDASGATDGSYGTATESSVVENDLAFTVSATQDVTFTVNGSVDVFQCEEGAFRSSLIETAGAAGTRNQDLLDKPIGFDPQDLTIYVKHRVIGTDEANGRIIELGDGFNTGPGSLTLAYNTQFTNNVEFELNDGDGTTVQESLSGISHGDILEGRITLDVTNLEIGLGVSVNGGAETTTAKRAFVSAASWDTDKLFFGLKQSRRTLYDLIAVTIPPGIKSMAEMRVLSGEG